jgi:hypothetical protein
MAIEDSSDTPAGSIRSTAARVNDVLSSGILRFFSILKISIPATIAGFGAAFVVLGVLLDAAPQFVASIIPVAVEVETVSIVAGMFGVWGATFVLLGIVAYLAVRAIIWYGD